MRTPLFLLAVSAALVTGCCRMFDSGEEGCQKDTDCKGDRVCLQGQCSDPPPGGNAAPPQGRPPPAAVNPEPEPQPQPAPRPIARPQPAACSGEETPCGLGGGRWGWCKAGRCINICPGSMSYSPLDSQCHPKCTASCENCMQDHCMDVSAPAQP